MLYILLVSRVRGTASKALLMSSVSSSVLWAGLFALMPSLMFCVRFVSRVVVEWFGRKPCCVAESGMCGVVLFRIRRSHVLFLFSVIVVPGVGLREYLVVSVLWFPSMRYSGECM